MNLVLDNNQLSEIPKITEVIRRDRKVDRIVLSAHSLAEMLLRRNYRERLAHLEPFRLYFGFEACTIAERLTTLPLKRIPEFQPYYSQWSDEGFSLEYIVENADAENVAWGRKVKDESLEFSHNMLAASQRMAREFKKIPREKRPRYRGIEEAMKGLAIGKDSYLSSLILESLSNGGKRQIHAGANQKFVRAVMSNQYLARFFGGVFCYTIGISKLWNVLGLPRLQADPRKDRDDWTDFITYGYAADGDVILTADKIFREFIQLCEPDGRVRALTVDEFLRS